MPKLHGFTERNHFNVYNAFRPRDLPLTMFDGGMGWVSQPPAPEHWQSMSGYAPSDSTTLIVNWWARSNCDPETRLVASDEKITRAWNAWSHVTTVTMVLGMMPVWQRPLAALLDPQRREETARLSGEGELRMKRLEAQQMYERYCEASGPRTPPPARAPWESLPPADQEVWLKVASVTDTRARPIIVPIRQTFYVKVETEPRALGALLEVLPTDVAPQALVWVHLDGVSVRYSI
jgi:hypothetical protein